MQVSLAKLWAILMNGEHYRRVLTRAKFVLSSSLQQPILAEEGKSEYTDFFPSDQIPIHAEKWRIQELCHESQDLKSAFFIEKSDCITSRLSLTFINLLSFSRAGTVLRLSRMVFRE